MVLNCSSKWSSDWLDEVDGHVITPEQRCGRSQSALMALAGWLYVARGVQRK